MSWIERELENIMYHKRGQEYRQKDVLIAYLTVESHVSEYVWQVLHCSLPQCLNNGRTNLKVIELSWVQL